MPNKQATIKTGDGSAVGRVGVAFSSGFFGFFAHAGFLSAQRELGIVPSAYAGASSGAIVAAMAACGMRDRAIKEMLFNLKKEHFWDPDPWHYILRKALSLFRGYTGYLKGDGFAGLLGKLPVRQIEACEKPLAIAATNLTEGKDAIFTRGNLIKVIQASGAVPMLFKPVEIDGSLYVDGGITNKCPLIALADLVDLKKIIVHFIASENMEKDVHGFLGKRMTPWHIQYLAVNIARQDAYQRQLEIVRMRGIEVIEVRTKAPCLGPGTLDKGPAVYNNAKATTLEILSNYFPNHLP